MTLLAAGLSEAVLSALSLPEGVRLDRCDGREVATRIEASTVAVLAATECGVDVAQVAHRAAPEAAVVFLTDDPADRDALNQRLSITPGIGRYTTCLLVGEEGSSQALTDHIDRAVLRMRHRQTMSKLRRAVTDFGGAAPETLSRYLSQLFDHAPLGILISDPDGTIRVANPGVSGLLGWEPRHAVGVPFPSMFSGHDAEVAAGLLEDCASSGDCSGQTLSRTGPDGSVQHLEVTVASVDPDHWDLGMFILLRDESARVHAIEVAEQARATAEAAAERYAGVARTLQESLLPPALPDIPGIDIGARYHPAGDGSEVGGDFYDVFPVTDDEWFAVMGDVCGKGVGAARLTALTRYSLRATTIRSRPLEDDLADLNATLLRQYEEDLARHESRFATATVIRFRRDGDELVVRAAAGGHYPPLIVRADGSVVELACRGPLLGIFPGGTFVTDQTRVGPGEVLLLFTDGVTEARRGEEQFGEDGLRARLSQLAGRSATEVVSEIEDAVMSFQSGLARDDIAVLAISPARD